MMREDWVCSYNQEQILVGNEGAADAKADGSTLRLPG
jgi:hypothetical protein